MSSSDLTDLLSELLKRVKNIERCLNDIRDELSRLSSALEKVVEARLGESRAPRRRFVDVVREMVYLDLKEVRSKEFVRRLVDRGELVLLKDDVLNLEVVTTRDVIKRIIDKLPLKTDEVDKVLKEREYHLLKLLNRLGYVLVRDGVYVRSDLADDLIKS